MSTAEHREQKPDGIRTTIAESLSRISEQSTKVQETITQALKNGSVDLPAVIAALELNGQFSATMQSFLEHQGQVVFSKEQSVQPTVTDNSEKSRYEPSLPEGPKTFGELLRAKIDNELLPADKDSFTKSDIFEAARDTSGIRRASLAEGISAYKSKLTREQVIKIIYRFFTTPQAHFKKRQDSYSLQEFKKSFVKAGNLISELSQEINYDWSQNPTVDYQTAMELRGLVNLEKVLTGEKVAKKGRPGAQFARRLDYASTQSTEAAIAFPEQP